MPKYKVIAHRRVHNVLVNLKDEKLKNRIKAAIEKDGIPPKALVFTFIYDAF